MAQPVHFASFFSVMIRSQLWFFFFFLKHSERFCWVSCVDFSFICMNSALKKTPNVEILNVLLDAISSHTLPFSGSCTLILKQEQTSEKSFVPLFSCLVACCWVLVFCWALHAVHPPLNPDDFGTKPAGPSVVFVMCQTRDRLRLPDRQFVGSHSYSHCRFFNAEVYVDRNF